jgi:hypothetical protein
MGLDRTLLKLRLWEGLSAPRTLTGEWASRESFYRNLLMDAAAARSIKMPELYPIGGAANYTLLSLMFRICVQLPVHQVLELGAGQSSLLLDTLMEYRKGDMRVTTIEHDKAWAARIGARCSHPIKWCPLKEIQVGNRTVLGYESEGIDATGIDFLIVDGPVGTARFSRLGMMEIAKGLGEEFVVLFDDAGRRGEQDTIREFMNSLHPDVRFSSRLGAKSQFLAFTKAFAEVAYF